MTHAFKHTILHLQQLAATKGIQFGLDRFNAALLLLNNPQNDLTSVIHVAGTNGKGSTLAFLEAGLLEEGYSVATFTSPHLSSYCERLALNGAAISEPLFCDLFDKVKPVLSTVALTEFEILTLMFIVFCQQEHPQYILLETGLGGRLDATNCLPAVTASIITAIHYDHLEYLGDTLTEISGEKAGIIKYKCPVFTFKQNAEIMTPIYKKCKLKEAPLDIIDKWVTSTDNWQLTGDHQCLNASLAGAVLSALLKKPKATFLPAFKKASLPCRFEHIRYKGCTVILDTAHNQQGIDMLCQNLARYEYSGPLTAIVNCQKNRPLSIFSSLFKHVDQIYCCDTKDAHFYTPDAFKMAFSDLSIISINVNDILHLLPTLTTAVCTGSMFFVGPLRSHLKDDLTC